MKVILIKNSDPEVGTTNEKLIVFIMNPMHICKPILAKIEFIRSNAGLGALELGCTPVDSF